MLKVLDLVPSYVWALVVAALMVVGVSLNFQIAALKIQVAAANTAVAGAKAETEKVKTQHAQLIAQARNSQIEIERQAREREHELQAKMDSQRKADHAKYVNLAAERDTLRLQFQSLAERFRPSPADSGKRGESPGKTAGIGEAAPGGDQPRVSGPIEDLIDEATRADKIRVALLGCYRAYDDARNQSIDSLSKKKD